MRVMAERKYGRRVTKGRLSFPTNFAAVVKSA